MFRKEVTILSRINHPNIVQCFHSCEVRGYKCIISPWAEHGTMRLYLERNPEADRLKLLHDVASALAYLHTRKAPIIHCDIYVDNVLVSEAGTALLNDFGLSRRITVDSSETPWDDKEDYFIGRALYEAPEVHEGVRRSGATDVFAFGMLVFHTYLGRQPFARCPTQTAIIIALSKGERPGRDEITRYDFEDAHWELVQACWHHSPTVRPTMPVVRDRMRRMLDKREGVGS
ncbi:kinase-like protein [Auricularia subglabra TFB-10046 SS5]|nr:kinase-like protein [Auricularia subglabra TFB-10046 SS5]